MPKIVDHQHRRAAIAAAACDTIAAVGLAGATLAQVAATVGLTTGAIQHYFRDKDRLLEAALRYAYQDQLARMARQGRREPYRLSIVLAEALPLSARGRRTMRVWLAFWGRAIGDPRIARAQRDIHDAWSKRVREELETAIERGVLAADSDLDYESEALIAHVRGICIRALLDPGAWPRPRQLALLHRYLERIPGLRRDAIASPDAGVGPV